MVECIFTIDYEIYGNGQGSLRELVYLPMVRLKSIFDHWNAKFVVFVEAAEFERIEACAADVAIDDVRRQVKMLAEEDYEIGLHIHPQWCNARFNNGKWKVDYSEYNLCSLARDRIEHIVAGAITYLRGVLVDPRYSPHSFRAGNWLFQPTMIAATVLAEHGIKVDSSVYKGGLQRSYGIDYRRAAKNGYFWRFMDDVTQEDSRGVILEIPIYTQMVPFWKLLTGRRLALERKGSSASRGASQRVSRVGDLARLSHPMKFDFCRMSLDELVAMIDAVCREDQANPSAYRPIVAIGHTKDLVDFNAVEAFLKHLKQCGIAITTLNEAYTKC
jgi:hypothetical protein